jgi:hypothetical protein
MSETEKPSGWVAIARRYPNRSPWDTWLELPGAPVTIADARRLVDAGIATTAQRRDDDRATTLLFRYLNQPRRR